MQWQCPMRNKASTLGPVVGGNNRGTVKWSPTSEGFNELDEPSMDVPGCRTGAQNGTKSATMDVHGLESRYGEHLAGKGEASEVNCRRGVVRAREKAGE